MTTMPSEANTSDQEHLEEQVLSTDSETGNTTSITVSTTNSPTPAMNQAPHGAADLPIEGTNEKFYSNYCACITSNCSNSEVSKYNNNGRNGQC